MRDLTHDELSAVSGGLGFVETVATGSAVGGTFYGGVTALAGYSTTAVTAAFTTGASVGGILGCSFFLGYEGATMLGAGALGGMLGTEAADLVYD